MNSSEIGSGIDCAHEDDPRIESALEWCRDFGLGGVVLAVPFCLQQGTASQLLGRDAVTSLLVSMDTVAGDAGSRCGTFLPADYSWRLPDSVTSSLLFIGPRIRITAPMIRAAMTAGIRRFIYWDIDRWVLESIWSLAASKLANKLIAGMHRLGELSAGHFPRAADILYLKGMGRALRATTELSFGPPVPGRILIACPTLVAGGAERQIVNTALGLVARGRTDVSLLVANLTRRPGNDFFLPPLAASGILVREPRGPTDSLEDWVRFRDDPALARQIRRVRVLLSGLPTQLCQDILDHYLALRELRPSVVHCWLDYSNVRAGLAALIAGVPTVILSGRNVGPVHFPYIFESTMRSAYRTLATYPQVTLVNNSHAGAEDYAAWLGLPIERFRVIYNGVNLNAVRRPEEGRIRDFREEIGIGFGEGCQVVGGMFRFSPEKRPLLWLEAAIRLVGANQAVQCVLFGEGPMESEMQHVLGAADVGARVRILEPTRDSALALAALDVLLLTSRWEGTPNVAIEAQAVGTPVVATGGGGVRESFEPGVTGLFVEEATAVGLAKAVEDLLADRSLRERIRTVGPFFVRERFAIGRMVDETLDLYEAR